MTLVEKLRQMIVGSSFGAAMTLDRAASEIERLTAENNGLKEALSKIDALPRFTEDAAETAGDVFRQYNEAKRIARAALEQP